MHFSLDVLKPIAMETIFGSLQVLFSHLINFLQMRSVIINQCILSFNCNRLKSPQMHNVYSDVVLQMRKWSNNP